MSNEDEKHRSHLPIPTPERTGLSRMTRRTRRRDFRQSSSCAQRRAHPNVLLILIDDAGFGCSSAFGGPCQTPTAESWLQAA